MGEQEPTKVMLNGGVYPNEDGTWRVCCWFTGISTEAEAAHINGWLGQLLSANIKPAPPPHNSTTEREHGADLNRER